MLKNEKKLQNFGSSEKNNWTTNKAENDRKVKANLEYFEAKKQITAQRRLLKPIKQ